MTQVEASGTAGVGRVARGVNELNVYLNDSRFKLVVVASITKDAGMLSPAWHNRPIDWPMWQNWPWLASGRC